jgi:DNA-binding transcriptional ArsR family regulator
VLNLLLIIPFQCRQITKRQVFLGRVFKKGFVYYLNPMETIATDRNLHINDLEIKKAALVFRAVNHPLRQQMLRLLDQNKQLTVTSLYGKLNLEQSVASQHLAILRKAGLVSTKRDAKFIYYAVSYQKLEQMHSIAAQLISR